MGIAGKFRALSQLPPLGRQLDADISLDGESVPSIESFSGTLDGAGHAIDGYTLSGDRETDALVRENHGTIRALALTDVEVTGPNTADTAPAALWRRTMTRFKIAILSVM